MFKEGEFPISLRATPANLFLSSQSNKKHVEIVEVCGEKFRSVRKKYEEVYILNSLLMGILLLT